jgi:adenosylhomocysteine nucleosidase
MQVLILAAMDIERELLLSCLQNPQKSLLNNTLEVHTGQLDGVQVSIAKMGIGKVNAAMVTTLLLSQHPYDLVINTGVAGAVDQSLQVGDVVISDELSYHDVDARHFGYALGQVPGMQSVFVSANRSYLHHLGSCFAQEPWQVVQAMIISGDQFISEDQQIDELARAFPLAKAVEMEGASVAHVASVLGVPFVVVRAISDKANSDAKMSYEEFVGLASMRSAQVVRELLKDAQAKRK